MPELWIPSGTGHSDFTIRKSRFIGEAGMVQSVEEARLYVKKLRMEHPRSRHVAWAYVLGKDAALKGMSDAGEPRGTAGRPIMDPIGGNHLTDVLVTVVRYFGGVKLGTGGLSSAYGKSSQDALEAMSRVLFVERIRVDLEIEYPVYEQVMLLGREMGGQKLDETFESSIILAFDLPVSVLDDFCLRVKDITRGTVQIEISKRSS